MTERNRNKYSKSEESRNIEPKSSCSGGRFAILWPLEEMDIKIFTIDLRRSGRSLVRNVARDAFGGLRC